MWFFERVFVPVAASLLMAVTVVAMIGLAVGALVALSVGAPAHDGAAWIMKGGHKNGAGEWCCGEGDCFTIPADQVTVKSDGYRLYGIETVPFSEAQPSMDGQYWRCKRPDGTRRCFFAPPGAV